MNIPLIIYRISGWLINVTNIFLAIFALKTKKMWQGKYIYVGLEICFVAVCNIISSITAILLMNNHFIDYLYVPVVFTLKALYLRSQHSNSWIRRGVLFFISCIIIINIINAVYKDGYKQINTIGAFMNTAFFLIFTVGNLTLMFKNKGNLNKLRQNPDFWFTASMFCFAFMGLMTTILTDVSYAAGSDLVLYILFISENLIDVGIFYGYYRAIKLLR
jgi:hypothetical protein